MTLQQTTHVFLNHCTGSVLNSSPCSLKSENNHFLFEVTCQKFSTLSAQLHQSQISFPYHVHLCSSLDLHCSYSLQCIYVHLSEFSKNCLLVFKAKFNDCRVRESILKLQGSKHEFFLLIFFFMTLHSLIVILQLLSSQLLSIHRIV